MGGFEVIEASLALIFCVMTFLAGVCVGVAIAWEMFCCRVRERQDAMIEIALRRAKQ